MEITMTDDRPNDAGKMMQLLELELSEREFYFIWKNCRCLGRFRIGNIHANSSGVESEFSK
jgi:hypothetical protein